MKILVLGLGNDLIADDAIGPLAVRRLAGLLAGRADVVESPLSGVALLEQFLGYERALVIDAVQTGGHPPGTLHELGPADLDHVVAPSPHYTGLPELFALAREMQLEFPVEVVILGVEVADPYTLGGPLSPQVEAALPRIVERVVRRVEAWESGEAGHAGGAGDAASGGKPAAGR